MRIIPTGIYRHYKGEHYYVLFVCRLHHSGELYVAYMPLYFIEANAGLGVHVTIQPLERFDDFVDEPEFSNGPVRRFTYVGPSLLVNNSEAAQFELANRSRERGEGSKKSE
jgi:hypothetical protein